MVIFLPFPGNCKLPTISRLQQITFAQNLSPEGMTYCGHLNREYTQVDSGDCSVSNKIKLIYINIDLYINALFNRMSAVLCFLQQQNIYL